jgi:hypothetical protein
MLMVWSLLGVAFMLAPEKLVRTLTSGRAELPRSGVLFIRVLGAVNVIGTLHVIWTGKW